MADFARWKKWLNLITPRSGRIRMESGAYVNEGDALAKLAKSVDILGQMNTAEYTPIVAEKPLPGLSVLRDRLVGGDTEFSVVGGEIRIDGTPGLRSLYTLDYGLYLPGLLGLAGLRVRLETPNTGTYRYGYGNGAGDRVGIENINGAWTTFVESDGTRWYSKPRSEWLDPLDGTGPSGVSTDLNGDTFRIILGWYGGISILFSVIVADREGGDRLVVFDASGERQDGVTLSQPDLPIFAEADGGVAYIGGRQYGVYGRYKRRPRITSNRAVTKSVGTSVTPIVSMKVKNTKEFLSVPVMLDGETVISTENVEYFFIIGGQLTGDNFVSIDGVADTETALTVDTVATAVTGGYRAPSGLAVGGQGNSPGNPSSELPDISIPAGTVVTLAAVSIGATADVTAIMRIKELW